MRPPARLQESTSEGRPLAGVVEHPGDQGSETVRGYSFRIWPDPCSTRTQSQAVVLVGVIEGTRPDEVTAIVDSALGVKLVPLVGPVATQA